ncbi:MAG: Phosphoribosylglycinamide formyltransferase [Ignavibacteriae bacterium]|nr:MAG: Phosphoribosylglycinamide formyltransferase [Ignavibacteriota bacterium]
MAEELKIAVFASGKGSNLKAILDAIKERRLINTAVVCVISNKKDAGALEIAKYNNIPAYYISQSNYSNSDDFDAAIIEVLIRHSVNFIVLAGYLKLLSPRIVRKYKDRILNIHPALLPKFGGKGMYGLNVHRAVIECGEKISGATVHLVDEEYDHGPIVLQDSIELDPDETPESLQKKIQEIEHRIYPEAIKLFVEGKFIEKEIINNEY